MFTYFLQVYKTQYAANPFENMSEEEIARYKFDVEHKGQGLDTVQESMLPTTNSKVVCHVCLMFLYMYVIYTSNYCFYLTAC